MWLYCDECNNAMTDQDWTIKTDASYPRKFVAMKGIFRLNGAPLDTRGKSVERPHK
jgi:hypothetical protein